MKKSNFKYPSGDKVKKNEKTTNTQKQNHTKKKKKIITWTGGGWNCNLVIMVPDAWQILPSTSAILVKTKH